MALEIFTCNVAKPKNQEMEKLLSNLKLKLAEYADDIQYIENLKDITITLKIPSNYNRDELAKLIQRLYVGHTID
jgi:hypothetical protein